MSDAEHDSGPERAAQQGEGSAPGAPEPEDPSDEELTEGGGGIKGTTEGGSKLEPEDTEA